MSHKNLGELDLINADQVDLSSDRFFFWDDSESGRDRSKAILVGAVSTLLSRTAAPQEAETDAICFAGQPLYLKSNEHVDLAQADTMTKAQVCGLCVATSNAGFSALYQISEVIEIADWSGVAGTVSLQPGQFYFLSATRGQITTTPPMHGFVTEIGQALSKQKLKINISLPIQL